MWSVRSVKKLWRVWRQSKFHMCRISSVVLDSDLVQNKTRSRPQTRFRPQDVLLTALCDLSDSCWTNQVLQLLPCRNEQFRMWVNLSLGPRGSGGGGSWSLPAAVRTEINDVLFPRSC